jgi:hypothetical protein
VKRSTSDTTATAEKPALSDQQRAARLELLAERLLSPDGLDRDTLARIEQLTGDEP